LKTPQGRRWILLGGGGALILAGLLFVTAMGGGKSTDSGGGVNIRPGTEQPAATAVEQNTGQASGFSLDAGEAVSLIWRLVLVAVIIGVAVIGLRWWGKRAASPRSVSGFLRVVDTLAISNGRSIHLVALGDRVIAIGATANQLTLLSELLDEESAQVLDEAAEKQGQTIGNFAIDLFRVMKANAGRGSGNATRSETMIGEEPS
jgi:flagellar protein FliO/FliZ